jgi:hypothetical protein
MDNEKKFKTIVNKFASDQNWIEIKKYLLEDIRATKEIIELIDKRAKERENLISKLN